jgi:hypothetical protein
MLRTARSFQLTSFQQAVLRRINWFRALASEPASVTFNPTYNSNAQQMAVIISANNTLNHTAGELRRYTTNGASVAGGIKPSVSAGRRDYGLHLGFWPQQQ